MFPLPKTCAPELTLVEMAGDMIAEQSHELVRAVIVTVMAHLKRWDAIMPVGPMMRALCLGNEAYCGKQFDKLPNCVNDASSVRDMVNKVPSCKAEFKTNLADKKAMETALADFLCKASTHPPRVLLFYFSGHGVQTGDELYLVPTGASPSDNQELKEQCLSHDEIFCTFKKWGQKVKIGDVMCVVVIDACRREINGTQCNCPFPETLEPRGNSRPEVWTMCVAAARSKAAYTSLPAVSDLSAFTRHFVSEECGLFEPNVPFKRALELVCQAVRLSSSGRQQDPTILGLERIPEHICLWSDHPDTKQYDVCFLFHEKDKPLAKLMKDQLLTKRHFNEGIFLDAETGAGTRIAQFASALCNSRIIALVVSTLTLDGISDISIDTACECPLSRLLLKYEMVLEILEHCPDTQILPILCGHEDKSAGRFMDIDSANFCFSDAWLATLNSTVKMHSLSRQARLLLRRFGGHLASKLQNTPLQRIEGITTPSLIKGRKLKETMQAIASLPSWNIEAMPKDATIKLLADRILKMLDKCMTPRPAKRQLSSNSRSDSIDSCVLPSPTSSAASPKKSKFDSFCSPPPSGGEMVKCGSGSCMMPSMEEAIFSTFLTSGLKIECDETRIEV